ncbi:uncharacterized protein KGF55_002963 [Candida pseudojiufengensis]|uniref:uncharacterized protein n=1 Tax=Candida pseudojiufengensis TaxID=497109 RepID=UPI0022240367|nr:uncharacterized protein KGF55_002963 [Candida pseudojiufengensis]KAI5963171.1 hypothetical protein KGF55_002963 [Candida pseudojiufengensis]
MLGNLSIAIIESETELFPTSFNIPPNLDFGSTETFDKTITYKQPTLLQDAIITGSQDTLKLYKLGAIPDHFKASNYPKQLWAQACSQYFKGDFKEFFQDAQKNPVHPNVGFSWVVTSAVALGLDAAVINAMQMNNFQGEKVNGSFTAYFNENNRNNYNNKNFNKSNKINNFNKYDNFKEKNNRWKPTTVRKSFKRNGKMESVNLLAWQNGGELTFREPAENNTEHEEKEGENEDINLAAEVLGSDDDNEARPSFLHNQETTLLHPNMEIHIPSARGLRPRKLSMIPASVGSGVLFLAD